MRTRNFLILATFLGIVACDQADRESRKSHAQIQKEVMTEKCNHSMAFNIQEVLAKRTAEVDGKSLVNNDGVQMAMSVGTDDPGLANRMSAGEVDSFDKPKLYSLAEVKAVADGTLIDVEANCDKLTADFAIEPINLSGTGTITEITENSIELDYEGNQIIFEEVTEDAKEDPIGQESSVSMNGERLNPIRVTIISALPGGDESKTTVISAVGMFK